jgi:hypothetical protein
LLFFCAVAIWTNVTDPSINMIIFFISFSVLEVVVRGKG